MKLEIGRAYVNQKGGWPSEKEILYYGGAGKWPGKCDHCGKEMDGKTMAYSFTIGSRDEDKAHGSVVLGSNCVKILKPVMEESRRETQRGVIAAIDASRTPYKIKCEDGEDLRISTQGGAQIRKLKVGDRVELEYAAGDWYAFPEKGKTEERKMRRVRDMIGVLDEASFPSAGKGMEWGEYEQVTPENLTDFVAKLKRDEGMFVIATYTRMTWFTKKLWDKWEAAGKPMIRVAKDGKGLYSLEGKKYVFSPSTSPTVKWVSRNRVEEGHMRTVRSLMDDIETFNREKDQDSENWAMDLFKADTIFKNLEKGEKFKFRRSDDEVLIKSDDRGWYKTEDGRRFKTGTRTAVVRVR